MCRLVVYLRVLAENRGELGCQGAVDVYGNPGYRSLVVEFMEDVDEFLGSAVRKCGNDYSAAALMGFDQNLLHVPFDILNRIVEPVPVGAFHDQKIHILHVGVKRQGRIFEDRFVESAQIAGITDGVGTAVFGCL